MKRSVGENEFCGNDVEAKYENFIFAPAMPPSKILNYCPLFLVLFFGLFKLTKLNILSNVESLK